MTETTLDYTDKGLTVKKDAWLDDEDENENKPRNIYIYIYTKTGSFINIPFFIECCQDELRYCHKMPNMRTDSIQISF